MEKKELEKILDYMVNDEDWYCMVAVAEHGYGLDKLVDDEDYEVRTAVAKQGYGLDKLINDEDWTVVYTVEEYIENHKN